MPLTRLFQRKLLTFGITKPAWYQRRESNSFNELLQQITKEMEGTQLTELETDNYPWCFICPDPRRDSEYFLIGAFISEVVEAVLHHKALYLRVKYSWLVAYCQTASNPAFWLNRALLIVNTQLAVANHQQIDDLIAFMRRKIESLASDGSNSKQPEALQSTMAELSKSHCNSDEKFSADCGVEVIPWLNWPNCLQTSNKVWLWRQSRFKKILEVQKILID